MTTVSYTYQLEVENKQLKEKLVFEEACSLQLATDLTEHFKIIRNLKEKLSKMEDDKGYFES